MATEAVKAAKDGVTLCPVGGLGKPMCFGLGTASVKIDGTRVGIELLRLGDEVATWGVKVWPEGIGFAGQSVAYVRRWAIDFVLWLDGEEEVGGSLLRDGAWLVENGIGVGSLVKLNLPDVGVKGWAWVRAVAEMRVPAWGRGRPGDGPLLAASGGCRAAGDGEPGASS